MAPTAHLNACSQNSFGVNARSARFSIPVSHTSRYSKDLRVQVRQALNEGDRHLVIDCADWNRFDLTMLSSLIQCAAVCREHGASFEVANMSNDIRESVRDLQLAGRLGLAD